MKKMISTLVSASLVLGGCATASKDVATNYVSSMQFQSLDCDQLAGETMRIQSRVTQLGGRLDEAASHDQAIAGIGLLIFWPALFALGGTKQQEADYARLKGEYDAIQQSAIAKKCPGMGGSFKQAEGPTKLIVGSKSNTALSTEERLQVVKNLYEKKLINEQQYDTRVRAILGEER